MSSSAESPPAGWYADPAGSGGQRYWDGGNWSQVTRPANARPADYVPQEESVAGHATYQPGATSQRVDPGATPWTPGAAGQGMVRQPVLAGFWWRVLAAVLDSLILAIPLGILVGLVLPGPIAEVSQFFRDAVNAGLTDGVLPEEPTAAVTSLTIFSAAVWFTYRTVMVALKGATLGKLILGLRVLRVDAHPGTNPPWGTAALRALAAAVLGWIPLVGLADVLVMLFTPRKQTVHDMLARTIVYKK